MTEYIRFYFSFSILPLLLRAEQENFNIIFSIFGMTRQGNKILVKSYRIRHLYFIVIPILFSFSFFSKIEDLQEQNIKDLQLAMNSVKVMLTNKFRTSGFHNIGSRPKVASADRGLRLQPFGCDQPEDHNQH